METKRTDGEIGRAEGGTACENWDAGEKEDEGRRAGGRGSGGVKQGVGLEKDEEQWEIGRAGKRRKDWFGGRCQDGRAEGRSIREAGRGERNGACRRGGMTNWAYREEEEGLFRERKSGRRVGESGYWLGVRGKWERVSGWKKGRQEAAWGIVENRGGVRNMRDVLAKKGAAREFVGYWWAWRLRGKAWGDAERCCVAAGRSLADARRALRECAVRWCGKRETGDTRGGGVGIGWRDRIWEMRNKALGWAKENRGKRRAERGDAGRN